MEELQALAPPSVALRTAVFIFQPPPRLGPPGLWCVCVCVSAPQRVPLHFLWKHICRMTVVGVIVLCAGMGSGGVVVSTHCFYRSWFWSCVWVESTFKCTVVLAASPSSSLLAPPTIQRRG